MVHQREVETTGGATGRDGASPGDNREKRAMQGVLAALKQGRHADATRRFKEAQACHVVPEDSQLEDWLGHHLGKQATAQLAKAFALTPCFYCEKGRESCPECDGRGHHAGATICEACLGIGVTRCDFCDGSAWVTINWVPSVFWTPVLTIRAKSAVERLKALVDQPRPEPSRRNAETVLKKCSSALLAANSLIGILENTVTAARKLRERGPEQNGRLSKLVGSCVRASMRANEFVRETLQRMAVAARFAAEAAGSESEEARLATTKAERYESLARSEDYADTFLEHPFLREAVREARKREEEQGAEVGRKSTKQLRNERTKVQDTPASKDAERPPRGHRRRQRDRG